MGYSLEEMIAMPHTIGTYLAVKDYLEETNDPVAYIYLIKHYIHDVPGIEIYRLMAMAHEFLDEEALEKVIVVLFKSI